MDEFVDIEIYRCVRTSLAGTSRRPSDTGRAPDVKKPAKTTPSIAVYSHSIVPGGFDVTS